MPQDYPGGLEAMGTNYSSPGVDFDWIPTPVSWAGDTVQPPRADTERNMNTVHPA